MRRIVIPMAIAAVVALGAHRARANEAEDKESAANVAAIMRDSGKLKGYTLAVKYKDGTVWLAGKVSSEDQLKAALQVCSDIDGVDQIVNNLKVDPSAAQAPAAKAGKPVPKGTPVGNAVRPASAQTAASTPNVQQATAQQPQAQAKQGAPRRAKPAGYRQIAGPTVAEEVPGPVMQGGGGNRPIPSYAQGGPGPGVNRAAYDHPHMPNYAWPSYAASPNYAAITYPKQYSASAFPFIGPFYPYPQVPLGWRKVSLEWDDGWWFLDFEDRTHY